MRRVPPGVGPKYPQVVVLVGATGDLSRRKLLPGLFHLVSAGFIPGCRIIGVSLDDIDADGFRDVRARGARRVLDRARSTDADWAAFAETARLRAAGGRRRGAAERRSDAAEAALGGESRRLHYLSVPPNAALSAVRLLAEAGLVERSRIIMEKPFGTDLASARVAERQAARGVRRGADLPHRPFPRQGAGAEHPRLPLRQRPVRADLEPQLHRSRADRRAGDAGPRQARRLLRADRRLSRHGGDAPVPDPRLHGDGAADRAGAGADQRGEEQGLPQHAADRPARRRARPVHRLPRRGGRRSGIRHRDLHRAEMRDRQLALGRRAVLPAHRQAAGRGPAHHLDRLPRAAEEHVPGRLGRRRARARTI